MACTTYLFEGREVGGVDEKRVHVAVLEVPGGEGDLLVADVLTAVVEHLELVLKPDSRATNKTPTTQWGVSSGGQKKRKSRKQYKKKDTKEKEDSNKEDQQTNERRRKNGENAPTYEKAQRMCVRPSKRTDVRSICLGDDTVRVEKINKSRL